MPGTRVRLIEGEGEFVIQPLTREHVRRLSGILKKAGPVTPDLLKERARDRAMEERKGARFGPR